VEQRKIEVLLKNPAIFQKNNSQKSGKSSGFLNLIFFLILDSCFTNVHTQKPILEQKLSPCVAFRDIDT
jgi:hypothetical protein